MQMIINIFIVLILLTQNSFADDCWMSLSGAGKKDGTDRDNAYGVLKHNANEVATKCWNQTSTDGTMYVLEGHYAHDQNAFWHLKMGSKHDGKKIGQFKKLVGVGNVRITGSRPIPYQFSHKSKGGTWIEIEKDAKFIEIKNFNVERVENGILAVDGNNHHLRFRDLRFNDTRQNIILSGDPRCQSWADCHVPINELSSRIYFINIDGVRYSKRHIRMGQGISSVKVINSDADSQFLDGDFAVGFDVENPANHIEFRNSTSQRNRFTQSEYWNGDGFKAETDTKDIRWINCEAYENADAGFDIKSKNAYFKNVVALRNSRNIRIWNSAILDNITASDAQAQGGNSTQAGIWSQGSLDCFHCTLQNNEIQIHAESGNNALLRFFDSLIYFNSTQGEIIRKEEGTDVKLIRTKEVRI